MKRPLVLMGVPMIAITTGVGMGFSWGLATILAGLFLFLAGWNVPFLSSVGVVMIAAGMASFSWWAMLIWIGVASLLVVVPRILRMGLERQQARTAN